MNLYESLLPFLMVRRYWRDDCQNLDQYEVSIKNFEDLKGFYIDCAETAFRLLVVGLAFALIEDTGAPIIKTAKGDKDIWWFEQINNGIKNGQLDKFAVFKSITASLDLGLRNGVGHHSAHYDVGTDEIAYVKADDAALLETRLPYTSFVDKVFAGYCAFEQASTFFHVLIADRLSEEYPLFRPQSELLREAGLVAVVEPGRQSLCGSEQIYVAGDETRINKIV